MKRDDIPLLVIEAHGSATLPPDTVVATWKFQARHADGLQAQRETDRQCQDVLGRLASIGFSREDLRLHQESFEPWTEYDIGEGRRRNLGFESSRTWVLRFPAATNRLGDLLACLRGSPAPCTITHELANGAALEDQAVASAIAKARRQAGLISESAGVRLGRIVSIVRGDFRSQHDVVHWTPLSAGEASEPPPPPKEVHGTETVTISWEIV